MSIKTFSVNLLILLQCSALFRGIFVECVHITSVSPVQFLESGSPGSVTLECHYEMDGEQGNFMVVKWFQKGDSIPIYQWLRDLGVEKYPDKVLPLLDKNYINIDQSNNTRKGFRAIRLISPPFSFSGEYECTAESLDSHDIQTTELIIYVKAKTFTMEVHRVDDGVNITCLADGVYPEPKLSLFRITQTNDSNNDNNINVMEVKDKTTPTLSRQQSGQYNIGLTAQIYDEDSYTTDDVTDHYECRLIIEKTDYIETRNLAIQSGWHRRPLQNSSNKSLGSVALVFMFLPLLAIINIISAGIVREEELVRH